MTLKLSRVICLMYRHSHVLPSDIKLLSYQSLICTHLNYCHWSWWPPHIRTSRNSTYLKKNAPRVICNVGSDFHTKALFNKLNFMKMFYNFRLFTKYIVESTEIRNRFLRLVSLQEKRFN